MNQRDRIRSVWSNMKDRCMKSDHKSYSRYGGRGISVCREWHEFSVFHDWVIQNGYAKGLQIDRINNDGNYEPGNCRLVTSKENSRNTCNTLILEYKGEKKCLTEWAEALGLKPITLWQRIRVRKWSIEDALTPKLRPGKTSKYRGVSRKHGKWQAFIYEGRKQKYLGLFDKEIDAARAVLMTKILEK